ncbi:hypothetical protein GCM10007884_47010 [Methylobacterium brachythecii]|uniref:Uncharacterized protein n=1 Tax=Methylobacterium brachythecii TaxID=1176177 RepID=A0ABQ6D8L8_9HYPH|nr:hypothetical protein GCM10007884_47010 [Methylobacterium brachythecii]
MPVAQEPPDDVTAHPAETDHAELHQPHPYLEPTFVIPGLTDGENPELIRDAALDVAPGRGFRVPLRGPGMTGGERTERFKPRPP